MDYSFPRYLLSKQTVDDRALNKDVLAALKDHLPQQPIRIIEVGAGIGTMLRRLIRWDILQKAEYVIVDESMENIEYASAWIPQWAVEAGLSVERSAPSPGSAANRLRLYSDSRDVHVQLEGTDVFDFVQKNQIPADLVIAHAFLDLLPMPVSLEKLIQLTKNPLTGSGKGLAWLTINFDAMTTFLPTIDENLDDYIERLYHKTMDTRSRGGNSKTGRHLFGYLRSVGAETLAAGASDWVVYANEGKYMEDESYFLNFILHFFEESLAGHAELEADRFDKWLKERRSQIDRGELICIAHQMDFLVKV